VINNHATLIIRRNICLRQITQFGSKGIPLPTHYQLITALQNNYCVL